MLTVSRDDPGLQFVSGGGTIDVFPVPDAIGADVRNELETIHCFRGDLQGDWPLATLRLFGKSAKKVVAIDALIIHDKEAIFPSWIRGRVVTARVPTFQAHGSILRDPKPLQIVGMNHSRTFWLHRGTPRYERL